MDGHRLTPDPGPGGAADSTADQPHVWHYWWPWMVALAATPTATTNTAGSRSPAVSTST